jgi:hypothetical protein
VDTGSGCHLLGLVGSEVSEGGMDPLEIVVALNIGEQIAPRFVVGVPPSVPYELNLERMKDALRWRIIVAAARPAHGRDGTESGQSTAIGLLEGTRRGVADHAASALHGAQNGQRTRQAVHRLPSGALTQFR